MERRFEPRVSRNRDTHRPLRWTHTTSWRQRIFADSRRRVSSNTVLGSNRPLVAFVRGWGCWAVVEDSSATPIARPQKLQTKWIVSVGGQALDEHRRSRSITGASHVPIAEEMEKPITSRMSTSNRTTTCGTRSPLDGHSGGRFGRIVQQLSVSNEG